MLDLNVPRALLSNDCVIKRTQKGSSHWDIPSFSRLLQHPDDQRRHPRLRVQREEITGLCREACPSQIGQGSGGEQLGVWSWGWWRIFSYAAPEEGEDERLSDVGEDKESQVSYEQSKVCREMHHYLVLALLWKLASYLPRLHFKWLKRYAAMVLRYLLAKFKGKQWIYPSWRRPSQNSTQQYKMVDIRNISCASQMMHYTNRVV